MKKIIVLFCFLMLLPASAFAQNYDISFSAASGNHDTDAWILGARKYFKPFCERGSFAVTPSLGLTATYLDISSSKGGGDAWVFNFSGGLTLTFDREKKNAFIGLYFGPSYISDKIVAGRNLGGHFQFGSTLSLGTKFGRGRHHSIEAFITHYSHAGLDGSHNDGFNVYGGTYRYHF